MHNSILHGLTISTHTLTWSVTGHTNTKHYANKYFNSHAHVERDFHKFHRTRHTQNFNSHAHVERDAVVENGGLDRDISTHTLTWSVTLSF